MKLRVPKNSTAASALPAAEIRAEIGLAAIITAMAISSTPSQFENAYTLKML